MILLENKTNITAPAGSFPFGDVINDPNNFVGTPVDRELIGDYIQFFEKMFSESGITANNLQDNNSDGFQLFLALEELSTDLKYRGGKGYTSLSALQLDTDEYSANLLAFTAWKKVLDFRFADSVGGRKIASMGDADVGAEIFIFSDGSASNVPPRFVINGTTLGGFPGIKKTGVAGADTDFIMTDDTTIHLVKMLSHWDLQER